MGARGSDDREWWCGWGCPAAPQHLHPLPGPAALGGNPAITNMVAPVQTALAPCFLGVTVAIAIRHERKYQVMQRPPWEPVLLCFLEVNINDSDIF